MCAAHAVRFSLITGAGTVRGMRATVIHGTRDIRVEEVADPTIRWPTDALVRVVASCVCGSDLWPYRGVTPTEEPGRIGHEFVGIVEEVGSEVRDIRVGQFVIAPFHASDGTCVNCLNGINTSCLHGAWWGSTDDLGFPVDGGQGERVRVPMADGTLVATPDLPADAAIPALLALSDVMCTGHHAAVAAQVREGSRVCVVGDGAVGLCAVIAAKRLGAERIVLMSRHRDRQALGMELGATDIVEERADDGAQRVRDLFEGIGADCVLEAVGTKESMVQALKATRPGGHVGYVGAPNGGPELPVRALFNRNIHVGGGVAPARAYIPELLPDVLEGRIEPGRVFDLELPLERVAEAYAAMDQRRAIKVLLRP